MKVLAVFVITLLAVNALSTQDQWDHFKAKHGKNYKNFVEEKYRFEVFRDNLKKIHQHNEKYEAGLKTWSMGVNKFADLTPKEFGDMLKHQNGARPKLAASRHIQDPTANVPEELDWRDRNAVLGVKDQGHCGSCWAFSATGAMEGQNVILNNKSIPLSEQELLDCSGSFGNGDCQQGGNMGLAFEYVMYNGLSSESDYPYEAVQRKCRSGDYYAAIRVKGYELVDDTETALKEAVATVGPISVTIYAEPIQFYKGGIFEDKSCYNDPGFLDHGVLAVAYGTNNGTKFWTIKNSWGADWGEDGFFRLARDADQCGIALDPSYPVLDSFPVL